MIKNFKYVFIVIALVACTLNLGAGELLETRGKHMLEEAFEKLEYSKHPCYKRAWLCCSKRAISWFTCCTSKKKVQTHEVKEEELV